MLTVSLALFIFFAIASFSSAQKAPGPVLVDKTFVPYSSAECGNAKKDCIIAVTTGMLLSLNHPHVVGNETSFVSHVKNVLATFPVPYTGEGYTFYEIMNATTQVLA